MEAKTEAVKQENKKEFESLLKEDFKKRDLKEGNIIKATVSEIGKKHVFVDLKVILVLSKYLVLLSFIRKKRFKFSLKYTL